MRVTPADLERYFRSFLLSIHLLLFSMVLLLVPAADVSAQSTASGSDDTPSQSEGIRKGDNELGLWGSVSFHSTTLIGKTPDARFGNIGLRYGRVLAASETVAFSWTIDAIPVAVLSNPRFTAVPSGSGFVVTQSRKSVYAWGAAPIGLKFNFRRDRRVQPFGHATGGFLYFNEEVPLPGAARFNFTYVSTAAFRSLTVNARPSRLATSTNTSQMATARPLTRA